MSGPDSSIGDHPVDDLAAYAVDALDGAEQAAVADHLANCPACRDDLAAYHETLARLAQHEPPPAAVWQGIAAGIGAPGLHAPRPTGPQRSVPAAEDRSGTTGRSAGNGRAPDDTEDAGDDDVVLAVPPLVARGRRTGRPLRLGWMAAAACVAVALGLGGVVGFAVGSSGEDDADIASLAQDAAQDPEGELATLVSPGGDPVARVVADEQGAYLVLDGLENLPEGRAYQLWSLTEAQPVSLGMLGRDGTNTVAFRLPPTITELAITEAPTNGDASPAGGFLASGDVTPS